MENDFGSADGSLQDVCEDETAVDGRIKVCLHTVSCKIECSSVIWVLCVNF